MVSALGIGASYGVGAADVERAFDRGVNLMYWGSRRRADFGRGVTSIARRDRDNLAVIVQSYSRSATALRMSLESALRRLRIERADVLLLGWWNRPPPERIIGAATGLIDAGKAGQVMVSCHNRLSFADYADDPRYGSIMVRYNAAHRGAEREVFPRLGDQPPGVLAYTATRWGALIDPRLTPAGEPTPSAADCYRFALTNPHVDAVLCGPRDGA
jgi:aryl-alcohol dehydrogenase-like predicted oxidoreductase